MKKYEKSNAMLVERIDHSNESLMERLNTFVGGLVQEQGRQLVSLTKGNMTSLNQLHLLSHISIDSTLLVSNVIGIYTEYIRRV